MKLLYNTILISLLILLATSVDGFSQTMSKKEVNNKMLTALEMKYNISHVPNGFKNCVWNLYQKYKNSDKVAYHLGYGVTQKCIPKYIDEIKFSDGGVKARQIFMRDFKARCLKLNQAYKEQINLTGYCDCMANKVNDFSLTTLLGTNLFQTEQYKKMIKSCFVENKRENANVTKDKEQFEGSTSNIIKNPTQDDKKENEEFDPDAFARKYIASRNLTAEDIGSNLKPWEKLGLTLDQYIGIEPIDLDEADDSFIENIGEGIEIEWKDIISTLVEGPGQTELAKNMRLSAPLKQGSVAQFIGGALVWLLVLGPFILLFAIYVFGRKRIKSIFFSKAWVKIGCVAILFLFLMAFLIVPWNYTFQTQSVSQVLSSAGYHILFNPPPPKEDNFYYGVSIDTTRLLIQYFVILVIGGVLIFYYKNSVFQKDKR